MNHQHKQQEAGKYLAPSRHKYIDVFNRAVSNTGEYDGLSLCFQRTSKHQYAHVGGVIENLHL